MITCQRKEIYLIRGDILEVYFEIKNIEKEAIKSVYFTSKSHDLNIECPYSNLQKGFCLRLGSELTSFLTPKISQYDLTIELIDGNKMTLIHNCEFIVFKKRNAVN